MCLWGRYGFAAQSSAVAVLAANGAKKCVLNVRDNNANPGRASRGNIGLLSRVLKYTLGGSPGTYRTESSVLLVKLDFIGTRAELCQFLCDTTNIDAEILMGGDLDNITVAQRTSWAYRRKTSGIEYIYCLGIFDFNIPLICGEGSQAFRLANRQPLSPVNSRFYSDPRRADHSSLPYHLLSRDPLWM